MEDPEEEPEIVECEECGKSVKVSTLGWMLNAGLRLGKKVVITGIVASSAPVVLPPLVVISALGFAISVPYGAVFASYVVTEKLMSKLLHPVVQYPEIEYEAILASDEVEERKGHISEAMEDDEIDRMRIELVDEDDVKVNVEVGNLDGELSAGEVLERAAERLSDPSKGGNQALSDMEEEGIVSRVDATKTDDDYVDVVVLERENEDKALPKTIEGEIDGPLLENEDEKNGMEEGIVCGVDDTKTNDFDMAVAAPELRDNEDRVVLPIVEGQVDELSIENDGEKEGIVSGVDAAKKRDYYDVVVVTASRDNEDRASSSIMEGQVDEPSVENEGERNGIKEGTLCRVDAMKTDDDSVMGLITESTDNGDRALLIVEGEINEPLVENEGKKNVMEEGIGRGVDDAKTDVAVSESRDNNDRDRTSPIVEGQVGEPLVENAALTQVEVLTGKDKILEEENVEVEKNVDGIEETGILGSKKETLEATKFLDRNDEQEDNTKYEELLEEAEISSEIIVQETSRDGSSNLSHDKEQDSEVVINDDVESIDGSPEKARKSVGLKEMPDVAAQEKRGDELGSEHTSEQEGVVPESEILINDNIRKFDGSLQEEQKPVEMEQPKGQSAGDGTVSDVSLETSKETSPSRGSMLADKTTESVLADSKVAESYSQIRLVANVGKCSTEMATIIVTPEPNHEEVTPQSKGEEGSPAVNSGLLSNEAAVRDQDIWKNIDAIRAIIGFKTTRQSSYFEELKALYIFTGIEPPSSPMDSSDLSEFKNMLSFLMSVIGVK